MPNYQNIYKENVPPNTKPNGGRTDNLIATTIRIQPEIKDALENAANDAGLDVSVAMRQIILIFMATLEASGGCYITALSKTKNGQ